jgi:pimeloyl-ACP methyl ester carboxylesterase
MTRARTHVNGIGIHCETGGDGDPLVLVHGSWVDATSWQPVIGQLTETFTVIAYDRRGHSRSERPEVREAIRADQDDLTEIIERFAAGSAHVVANSYGGVITLGLAARRPELIRSMYVHEPPAVALLGDEAAAFFAAAGAIADLIEAGDSETGACQFVEMVLGPGAWQMLPEEARETFIQNAPTFADEFADREGFDLDLAALAESAPPLQLSTGTESPPFFAAIADRIAAAVPGARRPVIEGAGHGPHLTHPDEYVELVRSFTASLSTA